MVACAPFASDAGSGGEVWIDEQEYIEIYQEFVTDFPEPMPDGITFPEEPPDLGPNMIGLGNAEGAAYFFWNCAWMDVYLTDTDPATKEQDLTLDLGHADSSTALGKRESKRWQGRTTRTSFGGGLSTCSNRRRARR